MKRRNLTLSLCLLAILAFSSIGFASWVITRPSAPNYAEGQIIVDDATNGAYTLVVPTEMGQIIFGSPATPGTYEEVWLNNTNVEHVEVLSQTISLEIDPAEDGKTFIDIKSSINNLTISLDYISYEEQDGEQEEVSKATNFNACVTANYIVEPVLSYYAGKDAEDNDIWTVFENGDTLDVDDAFNDSGVCTIKVEFKWGSWGGSTPNINPYDYYNSQDYSVTLANEAQQKLHDLYSKLNNVLYKLTIEG